MTLPDFDAFAALRGCRLLRAASDDGVRSLAEHASVTRYERGHVIAAEGDPAAGFGVVIEGRASVYHLGADGRKLLFETAEAGQPVAAVAALAGGRYPAYIEAATPATLAWVPREPLLELVEREPAFARSLIGDLAARVVNFTAVATTLSLDVPARVARFIFQRSLAVGRPTREGLSVELGMSKGELAASLGTVPETLSRALGKLRDEELLEVHGGTVIVTDVGGLARRGEGLVE
jgi:CRP/FNR family transcriptional regulator